MWALRLRRLHRLPPPPYGRIRLLSASSPSSHLPSYTFKSLYSIDCISTADSASAMLQSILSLLESNQLLLPTTTTSSSPQLKNISITYDSTLQRISNILSSPTLLQRYNNQDKSAINKAVKEVLTRHSASGSTIEWLFEHSCERLRMGERREDFDIGFEEVRLKCVNSQSRERSRCVPACALRTSPTKGLPDMGAASSALFIF